MIIIKTKGGLGNQMFQYAFGRSLSIKNNTDLALDSNEETTVKGFKKDIARPFLLDSFNIKTRIAHPQEIKAHLSIFHLFFSKIWRKIAGYNYFKFDPSFLNRKDGSYFEGFWWQSEKYFKDIRETLLQDFTLKHGFSAKAEKSVEDIRTTNSVSLHVRRGDYINDKATLAYHGLLPLEYYLDAINLIKERTSHPIFYIFSDDIEWVKAHLTLPLDTVFVSGKDISVPEELIMMSLCSHHIIANSSFSWWGAWLGAHKKKTIIAPKQWIKDSTIDTSDIYPSTWIKI